MHFEIKINMLLKADFSLLDLKFKYYIVNEYSVCTWESVWRFNTDSFDTLMSSLWVPTISLPKYS